MELAPTQTGQTTWNWTGIGILGHALEACLEPIRSKKLKLSEELVTQSYQCLDLIDKILKNPNKDLKNDPDVTIQIETLITDLIEISINYFSKSSASDCSKSLTPDELNLIEAELIGLVEKNNKLNKKAKQFEEPRRISGVTSANKNIISMSTDKESTPTPSSNFEMGTKSSTNFEHKGTQSDSLSRDVIIKSSTMLKKEEAVEISSNGSSTIRVQVSLLDRLMNLVGEMVLVRNQVLQHSLKTEDYEFLNLSQRLDLATSELQEDVMKTRMQPIGSILNKFHRVVRDISKELNKQIEFYVKGTETELDKSLLEAIKDPLTHIIRNSCDHGLESPEERIKIGKAPVGHVIVKAYHEGGQVVIEVSDDGRGLNLPKILSKAVQKKIVLPEKSSLMSDREIAQLIFTPGFSTAEQVSAISGRGVGMDVVKTNIEKAGGLVDLNTEAGKGTVIRLRIPLTLAIVPAMIVQSCKQYFAIPQVKLQELVRVDRESDGPKVEFLQGQPIFRLRGQLLPLVFINQIMNLNSSSVESTRSSKRAEVTGGDESEKSESSTSELRILNIVVLTSEGDPFGLVVDEIKDTADIVVKPLPHFLKRLNVYSGATIMGDGSVSLILDVGGVAEKARIQSSTTAKKNDSTLQLTSKTKAFFSETQEFLFFELNDIGRYCLPLVLVQRLEEFPRSSVEVSGKERIVKYRNSILPLINLNEYLKIDQVKTNPMSDKISVIVVSKRQRLFGIEVNQIYDVMRLNSDIEDSLQEIPGLLGNIINGDSIATVIDVLTIIETVIGGEGSGAKKTTQSSRQLTLKSKRKLKVLFAEDTPFFVRLVTKVLNDLNIDVDHAPDGAEALNKLSNVNVDHFDLILSDIEMPNMNGFDFAQAVRAESKWNKIPMIALTTRFNDADIKKGIGCGFNHYLEKLKADQLVDVINKELGGRVA